MLFTRTIRRKLLLGAALVMGMLLILTVSGISGLNSYRRVIRQLEHDVVEAPQKSDLEGAAVALLEPLVRRDDERSLWRPLADVRSRLPQKLLEKRLEKARGELREFRLRSAALPPTGFWTGQRPVTESLLKVYEDDLARLAALNERLADPTSAARTLRDMADQAAGLVTVAHRIPDPIAGVSHRLAEAKRDYRSSLVVVWITSAIAVALFLGLLRSGYVWIFDPIRTLHQGARRVAQGDFKYRVRLSTRDEMGELAEAFNKMTARFQEITSDLDRQVQERSRQLVRSERLAGVGFLAAGVAHEINNPLSAIAMAGESLEGRLAGGLDSLDPGEAQIVLQYLRMIQDESFRCRQITERLLDFSRGRDAARESTDVARLVTEVVAMVQHLSKYREKKIDFASSCPVYAEVNGPEIKQVVLNLVANGLDAVERGGTLRISLREQTDHLTIEFHDDGCGMTADVIENLFEPFFTRKQSGQGTGLGLSISHRIISQHGGTISAASPGAGMGSTFAVRLPKQAGPQSAAA